MYLVFNAKTHTVLLSNVDILQDESAKSGFSIRI